MLSHAKHVCLPSPVASWLHVARIPASTTGTPLIVKIALPVGIAALAWEPLPCPVTDAPIVAIGTPLIVAMDWVG